MENIFSQEEIDKILDVIVENDYNNFWDEDEEEEYLQHKKITLYDFKKPNRVSKEQLRSFKNIHDNMARDISTEFSSLLRSVVEIQLYSIDQITYCEFLMSIPNPTSFNIFSLSPLDGKGVLEISPSIIYPMIDRILGGEGCDFEMNRKFLSIEYSILDNILNIFSEKIKDCWYSIYPINPVIESKESSPNIVTIVDQNEIVVRVVMEIIIGNNSGILNICYPVIYLNPIFPKLSKSDSMFREDSSKIFTEDFIQKTINSKIEVISHEYKKTLLNVKNMKKIK